MYFTKGKKPQWIEKKEKGMFDIYAKKVEEGKQKAKTKQRTQIRIYNKIWSSQQKQSLKKQ